MNTVKVKSHKRKGRIVRSHSRKFATNKNIHFTAKEHLSAAEKAHKKAMLSDAKKAAELFAKAEYHRKEAKRK